MEVLYVVCMCVCIRMHMHVHVHVGGRLLVNWLEVGTFETAKPVAIND